MNGHEWASPHLPTDASSGNKENTTHTMYISWNTAFVKTVSNALSAIRKQEFQYMLFQGRSLERRRKQSSSPKGRWADRNHWGGCRQPPSPQLGRQGDSQGKGQVSLCPEWRDSCGGHPSCIVQDHTPTSLSPPDCCHTNTGYPVMPCPLLPCTHHRQSQLLIHLVSLALPEAHGEDS